MYYCEMAPHPALRKMVECYWVMRNENRASSVNREPVISDPGMEIFFNFAAPYVRIESNPSSRPKTVKGSHLIGLRTKVFIISQSGHIDILAVRFKPGGLSYLLNVPLSECTHRVIDMDLIFGSKVKDLEYRLYERKNDQEKAKLLDAWLMRMLYHQPKNRDDQALALVTNRIFQTRGMMPVRSICREFDVHYKKLERMFNRRIGVSPKLFSRMVRFHHTLNLLSQQHRLNAIDHPFYDQSHLIKDFKRFAGCTPAEFLSKQHYISDQLSAPKRTSNFHNT